eukprot:3679696-Amphidinium_carterae.3
MSSAMAVVRAGTSLRKRTGEPLDDGQRTLNHFALWANHFRGVVVLEACKLLVDALNPLLPLFSFRGHALLSCDQRRRGLELHLLVWG